MKRFLTCGVFVVGLLTLSSCGDDNDDEKSDEAFTAVGTVNKATSGTMQLTFADGAAGAKYFVMPYAVGSTSGDTAVQGGDETTIVTFGVTANGGSLALSSSQNLIKPQSSMTGREFDHALRSAINRFRPQDPESWQLVEKLENMQVSDGPYATAANLAGDKVKIRGIFDDIASKTSGQKLTQKAHLAGNCLDQSEITTIGTSDELLDSTTVPLKSSSTEYCLYVHATKGSITEPNLDTLKASIESILSSYKNVIYQDQMTKTLGEYKFIPHIFILPYGDATYWKDNAAGQYKITGAFSAPLTESNFRPSLYIAADQGAVTTETDQTKLNETFHATIAHEMQHAILHYYRYTAGLSIDSAQFDEGLAHVMEDILGYGQASFADFPASYLQTFNAGIDPVLANITSAGTASQRGAAQVMFYYLASQSGGISFDGKVSGGDGLKFIRSFVQGGTRNIAGLTAAYGGDWVTTIGNLFGAIAIDNASTVVEGSKYRVQSPEKGITDTKGVDDKTFGFRLNNYAPIEDLKNKLSNYSSVNQTTQIQVQNYMTKPMIYTLSSASDTIDLTIQGATNGGVSVIRFQ